uniref:Anaphase-promoting complex subunit 13 n=1 Tax=Peronospora matthiolae TaxID=2874970 RepID=A0AAV1VC92_9STRA
MDSKLPTAFLLKKHYLDIVDDDWIMDALSDDDIDVPPPSLELDQENGSESPSGDPVTRAADGKVTRWNDVGLDQWVRDTA